MGTLSGYLTYRPDLLNVRNIDIGCLPLLTEMERVGTAINIPGLQSLGLELTDSIRDYESKIRKHIPVDKLRELLNKPGDNTPPSKDDPDSYLSDKSDETRDPDLDKLDILSGFNVNSSEKVAWLLFDILGLGKGKSLKTSGDGKRISTGKKQLEMLKDEHEVVGLLLKYREVSKLKTTYVDKLPKMAVFHNKGLCAVCGLYHREGSHRIHTQFPSTRTETGRIASRTPNLMNIPARTELGKKVRACFTPTSGLRWVSVDMSQIELRTLAHCAREETMLDIYKAGKDIHIETARKAFNLGPDEPVDADMHRSPSKVVNFGVCITKGQQVLTDQGLVAIENITCQHKVWDGIEFVSHKGVVFNGYKQVIRYSGISATPDHIVFTRHGEVPLAKAMAEGYELVTSGSGSDPIKVQLLFSDTKGYLPYRPILPVCGSNLWELQTTISHQFRKHSQWQDTWMFMPTVRTFDRTPMRGFTTRSLLRNSTALQQSGTRRLSQLRSTRDTNRIQQRNRVRLLCTGESTSRGLQGVGYRSGGQQRQLHTRQLAPSSQVSKPTEQTHKQIGQVSRADGYSFGSIRLPKTGLSKVQSKSPSDNSPSNGRRTMAVDTNKEAARPVPIYAPVYDILDAGPRNRFTVEGKLVHNCYGMSAAGLFAQLIFMFHFASKPVPAWLTEAWCEEFIGRWFATYPMVKGYMQRIYRMLRRYGFVWNEFGFVRQIHAIWSAHRHLQSEAERQAGNMPIQGFAAILMKLWMNLVLGTHEGEGYLHEWREMGECNPLLTIHDELNFETDPSIAELVKEVLAELVEFIGTELDLLCPLMAEGKVMDYWKK